MTVGERIRQRRKELGMTQEELALKLGYKHKSSINKIELDQVGIASDKIAVLARTLGVSPDFFFYGSEETQTIIRVDSLTEENQGRLMSYYNYLLEQQNKED
jgi:transcriptional regulator with XRE-family HTH domain